ncbi:uncharacterized protein M421DRAFT_417198 [Didymella exigua CBS 183.55]|uniref:Uncharacterized protein n=1 Tax=Didymella exigua CBS 183.55 TaxID=1150837 RepID=A0A6A5RZM2_9PLEO|nr:uncharacterized protein M421DRAFT_417198 [Didymella exigua CBS 183.55]KAF1932478.1 hypothetical protein M421DRAFT_417198 [Didymella exigua CBS 183.55]
MNAESESSLPTEGAHTIRSSPPAGTQYSYPPMDDLASKSEPVAPQEVQQTQDVQQTPKRSRHQRMNSGDTERPASAQRDRRDGSVEQSDVEAQEISDDNDADPAQQIRDFDWQDLHERYHTTINRCSQDEADLMEEWAKLMEYFRIWAESGHGHETDRTYQRLQTRTLYVQNEEDEFESRRNHYINVVKAFESALTLLRNNSGTMFRG